MVIIIETDNNESTSDYLAIVFGGKEQEKRIL